MVYFGLLKEQRIDISSNCIFEFLFRSILTKLAEKKQTVEEMLWAHDFYYKTTVESMLNHCYMIFKEHGYSYLSTKAFDNVKAVISLFRGLKRLDDIMYYLDWDKKIQTICYEKFNQLEVYSKGTQQQCVCLMEKIFVQTIIQEFPEEYSYLLKEFSFGKRTATGVEAYEIVNRRPEVQDFIKNFDLELIKDDYGEKVD